MKSIITGRKKKALSGNRLRWMLFLASVLAFMAVDARRPHEGERDERRGGRKKRGGPSRHRRGGNRRRGKMIEHLLRDTELCKKIKLTEDQKKRLEKLVSGGQKEEIRNRAEMQIIGIDLRTELEKHKPNKDKVLQLLKKKQSIANKQEVKIFLNLIEIKNVLSKKQQDDIKKYTQEKKAHMKNKFRMRHSKSRMR